MAFTEQDKLDMDNAAMEAENELGELHGNNDKAVELVADWLGRYYMKAGYKRLGRVLLEYQTEKKEE